MTAGLEKSPRDIFGAAREVLSKSAISENMKIRYDEEKKVIRIYAEGSSALDRASSGLSEVLELSYTTAEHHPYWAVLYHSAEICKSILDSWDVKLSKSNIEEMEWRIEEIKMALERAKH